MGKEGFEIQNFFDVIYWCLLCKGQLITKANFLGLKFEPKNEQNIIFISALASKNGSNQNSEGTL